MMAMTVFCIIMRKRDKHIKLLFYMEITMNIYKCLWRYSVNEGEHGGIVYADTEEDLFNKIYEIDWSKIDSTDKSVGAKFDLSI